MSSVILQQAFETALYKSQISKLSIFVTRICNNLGGVIDIFSRDPDSLFWIKSLIKLLSSASVINFPQLQPFEGQISSIFWVFIVTGEGLAILDAVHLIPT